MALAVYLVVGLISLGSDQPLSARRSGDEAARRVV
jgi:hypothetical protein